MMHAIEDNGAQSDTAPLIVSEYWPTASADNGHSSETRLGVPNETASTSWWERTNWFRVHEKRELNRGRDEAAAYMGGTSAPPAIPAPVSNVIREEIQRTTRAVSSGYTIGDDEEDAAVPYGGIGEDGAQLGERYTGKASRGIGSGLSAPVTNEQRRLADAPGGAEVFCRFNTSSSKAAVAAASTVATPAPLPATGPSKVATTSAVPSLLARNTSTEVRTVTAKKSSKRLRLQSIQGYDNEVKRKVHELIVLPLFHPALFGSIGLKPSRGILLSGAVGGGKTSLVSAIVRELGSSVYFQHVDGAHLLTELQQDLQTHKASDPKNLESSVGIQNSGGGLGAPKEEGSDILSKLFATCIKNAPSMLFIDEVDIVAQEKKHGEQAITSKIRALLRLNLDRLSNSSIPVIVIGATNHPEIIDSSLLRTGRFDRSIQLNKPDENGRLEILRYCSRSMKMDPDTKEATLRSLAQKTNGFVGADLANLCSEAGLICIREYMYSLHMDESYSSEDESEEAPSSSPTSAWRTGVTPIPLSSSVVDPAVLANLQITKEHFLQALKTITPSSSRGFGAEQLQPVQWHEIGGTKEIKNTLIETIEHPLTYPHLFQKYGLAQGSGILLYGPPGCGKTLMARAIATQAKASFISVKGPELLSSYLGESESNIRALFARARAASPCVIFFDEIDSVALARGEGSDATCDRILNQLLTEMDGRIMGNYAEEDEEGNKKKKSKNQESGETPSTEKGDEAMEVDEASDAASPKSNRKPKAPKTTGPPIIFVVAATNRPDMLDPALMRPGRLDQLLFVGLPNTESREDILKKLLMKTPLAEEVKANDYAVLHELAKRSQRLSGADLAGLCNRARKYAINEFLAKHQAAGRGSAAERRALNVGVDDTLTIAHLEKAFSEVTPSVSDAVLETYRLFNERITRGGSVTSINSVTLPSDEGESSSSSTLASSSISSTASSTSDGATLVPASASEASTPLQTEELSRLRDNFRSEIVQKLNEINAASGGRMEPQQALNAILGDLLKQSNRDAWKPSRPSNDGVGADSNTLRLVRSSEASSSSSMESSLPPNRARKVGGREM